MSKHHVVASAVFAGIVIVNHKLGLELTIGELTILATVLGVHHIGALVSSFRAATQGDKP